MKTKHGSKLFLMSVVFLAIGLLPNAAHAAWVTAIPSDSMTPANFDTYWNWFYRWGDTHNGAAKMYVDQVTLDGSGMATIVAETPDPESNWKYRSGAFNSKADFKCDECYPEWDFKGEFKAPIVKGSWPAFWYTGSDSWPPEIDILEFKGSKTNWFNTYDGGWDTKRLRISDADTVWHEYRCHITQLNATDVQVEFYFDGVLKATHTGSDFVGEWMHVIVNMQMEGSSGTPGPTEPTYYYARNIVVQYDSVPPPAGPPASPANLTATFGDTEVGLNWDESSECDLSHYNVERSTTAGGPYSQIATDLTEAGYSDTGLNNGTTYYYVVSAVDLDLNESGTSNEASATPITLYPVAVSNYSFELPGTVKQQNWNNVPNWSSDSGTSDSGVESDYPATDGIWRGYLMSDDPSVWNLSGYTISSGEQFNLSIDAIGGVDNFKVSLYYDDSGSRVEAASKTFETSNNYTQVMVSFTADDVPASIGNVIGIEINNNDSLTTWVGFDNVRLSTSTEPAPDNTPPTPDPMTWATVPYATGSSAISMVATTATDENGVEYYFSCLTSGGHDSGWKAGTSYQDTGLLPETTYTYTVKARDLSLSQNQNAESTAEFATTSAPGQGQLPYLDDFESGDFVAGGWTTSGDTSIAGQASYEGSYGARIKGVAWIETAIDTSGFTDIHLKYVCDTFNLDPSEKLFAEWFDGTSWYTVNETNVSDWTAFDHTLGTGADNNPSFKIRFRVNANMAMERGDVDNVEVIGI